MDKGKAPATITPSLQKLDLNSSSLPNTFNSFRSSQSSVLSFKRTKPPSLVSLCLAVVGKHLEDIIPDLNEIAANFPADIKASIAAIARRRKLLNDDVILSLADLSWGILDISGSDVTDMGLTKVAETCRSLRAVDISRCSKITPLGVSELVKHCHCLEILRCGGCPRSDYTARRCLGMFKPKLDDMEGDSWEELDATEISHGGQSLRWLVWPKIDPVSLENISTECPRIKVNPRPSPYSISIGSIPREALSHTALDDPLLEDIDPTTWAVCGSITRIVSPSTPDPTELSMAEKFRLAFVERDMRLAPKRAKNARQNQRRAQREWMMTSTDAKALALASQASKSLRSRNYQL